MIGWATMVMLLAWNIMMPAGLILTSHHMQPEVPQQIDGPAPPQHMQRKISRKVNFLESTYNFVCTAIAILPCPSVCSSDTVACCCRGGCQQKSSSTTQGWRKEGIHVLCFTHIKSASDIPQFRWWCCVGCDSRSVPCMCQWHVLSKTPAASIRDSDIFFSGSSCIELCHSCCAHCVTDHCTVCRKGR